MTGRLTRRPGGAARLRALLESGQTIVAPGAFDPLAARLVEEAGFPAVYMTGFGTSAALIGRPDVGLLTMTEMAASAGRIADCVDIPVIADADTGYGNPLNVIRTVGAYETAGVAGIHIEDQVAPKKCGHMEGKLVIPRLDRGPDLRRHLRRRYDELALHVAALLGGHLVLDVDPGDPGRLVGADGADHVQRVAVAGVGVGDHRDVDAVGDPPGAGGHLGHGQQANVRPPDRPRRGAEPGHVHGREPGLLHEPGGQRVERPRRHDGLLRCQQGP